MAGHSKFKNIMYRKGAQDAKRAKVFTKIIREITVAARAGLPDPEMNPRLKNAVVAARAANMPKDNIERAIKRGAGETDGADFHEIRYEGYGPGGSAVIVDCLTDNRNRPVADVRHAVTKYGGSLAENGAVTWNFESKGLVAIAKSACSEDEIFEKAIRERCPLGREQTPEDIGRLAVFLASDYARNITGTSRLVTCPMRLIPPIKPAATVMASTAPTTGLDQPK